jgi:hypothetical protein
MKSILATLVMTLIFSLNARNALAYSDGNDQQSAPYEESESDSTCRGYGCDDGTRYQEDEGPDYSYEDPRFEEGESYEDIGSGEELN